MIHFKTVKHLEDGRVVETTHRLRGGLDAGFMMNGIRYSHQMLQLPAVLEKLARRYPSLFIHRSAVIDVLDAIPTPPEEDEDEKKDDEEESDNKDDEEEDDDKEEDEEEEGDEEEGDEEESSTTLINEENGSIKEKEDSEEEGDTAPEG